MEAGNATVAPLLLHMGGRGHGDKERIFRCAQMWFHENAVFCGNATWPHECSARAERGGAEGDEGDDAEVAAVRAQQSAAAVAALLEHHHPQEHDSAAAA